MSEPDVPLLVRRTRLLLRFYPKAYRAHRGEEIFGTLLDTTPPGRGWPPAREVASVIGGGLRARQAANLNQGLRASLRHLGILTAAMIMAEGTVVLLALVGEHVAIPSPGVSHNLSRLAPELVPSSLLAVMALAATWCGRRWLVAAAVAAAALGAVACVALGRPDIAEDLAVPDVLALVVLLPLTKRAERPPASLLWLPCLPVAVGFVEGLAGRWSWLDIHDSIPFPISTFRAEGLLDPYITYLSLVPVLVAVCWLVTDVRPLAAITLAFLLDRVFYAAFDTFPGESRAQLAIVVAGLSLALPAPSSGCSATAPEPPRPPSGSRK